MNQCECGCGALVRRRFARGHNPVVRPSVSDRFWEKVTRGDGCWEWTANKAWSGYGMFKFKGQNKLAHRMAWTLTNGDIPEGLRVCHHCDNRPCCNPQHLFLGTSQDNALDRDRKGRHGHRWESGEKHPFAKLTAAIAAEIRNSTGKERDVAKRFGVSHSLVHMIRRGQVWKTA